MEIIEQELQKGYENPAFILEQQSEEQQRESLKNAHNLLLTTCQKLKQNQNEKLIIKNTDLDQIWEQLKMHIDIVCNQNKKTIEKLYQQHQELQNDEQESEEDEEDDIQQKLQNGNQSVSDEDDDEDDENLELEDEFEDDEEENEQNEEDLDEELDEEEQEIQNKNDDEDSFEKMEKFLEQADIEDQNFDEKMKQFEKGELDEDIDDEDDMGSNYELSQDNSEAQDFFKKAQMKVPGQETDDEDDEDDENQQNQEEDDLDDDEIENDVFDEQRENKLQNETEQNEEDQVYNEDEISKYEKDLLGEKDWQQKGEIRAKQRPVDSLVQETLDFKNNQKEKEEITQEYTQNLEDIIKQRILDEAFDDRQRIVFDQHIKENFAEISRDKSEKGLAELYEDEFKSTLGLNNQSKDDKLKQEIMDLFKQTCYKLDALSNLNFTPKPITKQAEIQASKMKINIDEKIPLHLSSKKTQQNPNDLLNEKTDVTFKSKEEMTHQENRTERSKNKKVLRTRKKEADRKKMLKTLQYTGQTKHEYNLLQEAKKEGKKIEKNKKQQSVKFNKSGDFFKNLQSTLDNKNSNKPQQDNKSKKIKKASKL